MEAVHLNQVATQRWQLNLAAYLDVWIQWQEDGLAAQKQQQCQAVDAQAIAALQADLAAHRRQSTVLEHVLQSNCERLQQEASAAKVTAYANRRACSVCFKNMLSGRLHMNFFAVLQQLQDCTASLLNTPACLTCPTR